MGNAGTVTITSLVDVPADRYTVQISYFAGRSEEGEGTEVITSTSKDVDRIMLNRGANPSYAVARFPLDTFGDESPFQVALTGGGLLDSIKLNTRAVVRCNPRGTGKAVAVMTGTVVDIQHDIGTDAGVITVVDDRWLLSKATVFGQLQYDPETGTAAYVTNAECVFNQFGYCNCIDSPDGPRFAPTIRYGWKGKDRDEPTPGNAVYRARSWRVSDSIAYLRAVHYPSTGFPAPTLPNYGQRTLNDAWIQWPEGLGTGLETKDGEDKSQRVLHNWTAEGKTLLEVLVKLAQLAGPFEFNMSYGTAGGNQDNKFGFGQPVGTSTMQYVNVQPGQGKGIKLNVPGLNQDDITNAMTDNGAVDGFVKESIRDYYDSAVIVGDPPTIERRVGTIDSSLAPAWTTSDEDRWRDHIEQGGNTVEAFQEATFMYPMVFAAYQIDRLFDYLEGTKWAAQTGVILRRNPRIRPELLTGVNFDEDVSPRDWLPRQIVFEYRTSDAWVKLPPYDRLEVGLVGSYFLIPGLRDIGNVTVDNQVSQVEYDSPNHPTWKGTITDPQNIERNNIRLTCAIELDSRLSAVAGVNLDPNNVAKRVFDDQGEIRLPSYLVSSPPLDYIEWLRKDSYPMGVIVDMPDQFPEAEQGGQGKLIDRALADDELFSDNPGAVAEANREARIQQHVLSRLKDVKRIEGGGQVVLKQFEGGVVPGTVISGIQGSGIPVRGVVKSVTIESQEQNYIVEWD
jgi:hypothetical protein